MKVTVCQLNPAPGALEEGLAALAAHVKEAHTELLVLPEMCFSPWLAADKTPDGARWATAVADHNRHIDALEQLGAKAVMGTRPVITPSGSRRNRAYIWTAETGAEGFHEKYYLPDEEGYWENTWYDRGEKRFDVARALEARLGVQICTELWFFDWARHYARERVDILCAPRATPHETTEKWLVGGQAAAICAGAYCLSSNLWAPVGDKANLGGVGLIADPDGRLLAQTDADRPFATLEIDLEKSRAAKATYPRYVLE